MAENNSSAPLKTAEGADLESEISEHTAEADAIYRKLYNRYGHEQTAKNAREWIQIAKQLLDDAAQAVAAPQAQPADALDVIGHVRIDSGEVHIYPRNRDAESSGLVDGQLVYAAMAAAHSVPDPKEAP